MTKLKVPDRKDWGNTRVDSHLDAAYHLYAGKSVEEAIPYFVSDPFQQAQALRYATQAVFDYYVFCFSEYLTKLESAGESDMASVFMNLLVEKSEKDPKRLRGSIDHWALRLRRFRSSKSSMMPTRIFMDHSWRKGGQSSGT